MMRYNTISASILNVHLKKETMVNIRGHLP